MPVKPQGASSSDPFPTHLGLHAQHSPKRKLNMIWYKGLKFPAMVRDIPATFP